MHGRKMVTLGRSMEQNTAIAVELGYLDPRDGTLVRKDQLQRLPKEQLVVMTTGSQGEPMSGLTRMSNRDHRNITIELTDEAADWLERTEREEEERPGLLLQELKIKPGEVVADIGAGNIPTILVLNKIDMLQEKSTEPVNFDVMEG